MTGRHTTPRFATAAVLMLVTVGAAAAGRVVNIAVVRDGPTGREFLTVEHVRAAVAETVTADIDVRFPAEHMYVADWTLRGVDTAIDRALAAKDVDAVLLLGVLASHQAAQRPSLPRPVIAPLVVDPVLQAFPLVNGTSGRRNFTYAANFHGIGNSVRAFHQVVGFRHLAALVDKRLLDALPSLAAKADELALELGVQITIVPAAQSADALLAALPPDADAVYATLLMQFDDAEIRKLAEGLVARNLPSFSEAGRSEVEDGLMLTTGGAERDNERLARRIALSIQRLAAGDDPATFEVAFPTEQRFAINMQVATRIGFSPRWDVLANSEQVGAPASAALPTLTLVEAMREALDLNPALAGSAAQRDASRDEIEIARSALLPSVEIGAGYARIDADRASPLTYAEKSASVSVSTQQLVYSESAWAAYSISRSLSAAAEQGYRQDSLDTLRAAASAYLEVLRATALESVRRANVENTRQNLEISRVREEVGLAERSDYLRWVAELSRDKQSLLSAESTRRRAETELMRVLHRPSDRGFSTVESGIDGPLSLISGARMQSYVATPARWAIFTAYAVQAALGQAPEIAQSEAFIAGRERSVIAARRAFYVPDLALVGGNSHIVSESGAGSMDLPGTPDDESWSISLQATWPLFSGGRRSAELAKARHNLRASEANCHAITDAVEARTRDALHRVSSSFPSIELSRTAAGAADENLRMVTDAYGRGAVSVTELIDAQDTALEANLAATDATYGFLVDLVDVLRAMSEFDLLLDPASRDAWFDRVDEWFAAPASDRSQTCNQG